MKHLMVRVFTLTSLLFAAQLEAIEVVELRQENSNKVVFQVRFENGSIADPKGKEGLTAATASSQSLSSLT